MSENGTPKGKQKTYLDPEAVQILRLYRLLQRYSDEEHPIPSRGELEEIISRYSSDETYAYMFGSSERKTKDNKRLKRSVKRMADALNSDDDGRVRREDEWEIVYGEYKELYGDGEDYSLDEFEDEDDDDPTPEERRRAGSGTQVRGLYYKHPFSYEDLDALIDSLRKNDSLWKSLKEDLIKKIKQHLASEYYRERQRGWFPESDVFDLDEITLSFPSPEEDEEPDSWQKWKEKVWDERRESYYLYHFLLNHFFEDDQTSLYLEVPEPGKLEEIFSVGRDRLDLPPEVFEAPMTDSDDFAESAWLAEIFYNLPAQPLWDEYLSKVYYLYWKIGGYVEPQVKWLTERFLRDLAEDMASPDEESVPAEEAEEE